MHTALNQAARLLMLHMELMEQMQGEDWDALLHEAQAQGAAAHAALLRWLEAQFQDTGVRAFALLREQLRHSPHETLVAHLLEYDPQLVQIGDERPDHELRGILNRLQYAHIKAQTPHIAERASRDPVAAEQLRHLYARRRALEAQMAQTSTVP